MRSLPAIFLASVVLLAASGCATTAPPQAKVEKDASADFSRYATFAFREPSDAAGYSTVNGRLLDERVRAAIAVELTRRGYREVKEGPDMVIGFNTASREKTKSSPFRIGIGVGGMSSNVGGGVSMSTSPVDQYLEGTLEVDAVDTARKAQIWHGSMSGKIKDQTLEEASIRRVVGSILADFPTRTAPAP